MRPDIDCFSEESDLRVRAPDQPSDPKVDVINARKESLAAIGPGLLRLLI